MRYRERNGIAPGDPRCKAMRAAIYVRKSTATEGKSKSRDEQLEMCKRDAQAYGFSEVRVFVEPEGQKGDWFWRDSEDRNPAPHRPVLTQLVEAIERDEIDVVIVYKVDRLVRSTEVNVAIRRVFIERGVRFVAQGRDSELDTARGRYQNSVDAAVSEQWRDQISEDVRRDHDYKAWLGMFSRNPSCFGYRSLGKGTQAVRPVWEELALVHRIFHMFVLGEDERGPLGITAIANQLMDEGISLAVGAKNHKARNPQKVHTGQIKTILENPMYVGRWRHNHQEYDCDRLLVEDLATGERRTAIPIALFEHAQAKLASAPKVGAKSLTSCHLLSGIAVCGCCGRPLQVNHRRRADGSVRHTYICQRRRDSIPCSRHGTANLSERQLDEWAMCHLAPWLEAELHALRKRAQISDEKNRLADVERKLALAKLRETDQLAEVIGVLDPGQVGALAQKLRAEREVLEREVRRLRTTIEDESSAAIDFDLQSLNKAKAKSALRSAIDWIAVTDQGVVAKTEWGTFVGGRIVQSRPLNWNDPEPRRKLLAPDLASCAECLGWLMDPATFISGRRQYLRSTADSMSDEELLPGCSRCKGNEEAA